MSEPTVNLKQYEGTRLFKITVTYNNKELSEDNVDIGGLDKIIKQLKERIITK